MTSIRKKLTAPSISSTIIHMPARKTTVRKTTPKSTLVTEPAPAPAQPAQKMSLTPILVALLVVAAFALGYLYNRLQQYEKGGLVAQNTQVTPTPAEHPLTQNNLVKYAKELKMDEKKFTACVTSGKYKQQVQSEIDEGVKLGVNGTPAFFLNGHLIVGAQPTQVFTDAIDFALSGGDLSSPTGNAKYLADDNQTNGEMDTQKQDVAIGNAQVKGNKNASVTLIEYSDFECPYCGRFFAQSLPTILQKYVDTGKIYFAYKQFPLTAIHPHSQMAAEASLCAGDQGKFWQFHDKMFSAMQQSQQ